MAQAGLFATRSTHVDSCLLMSTPVDRRGADYGFWRLQLGPKRGFLGAERVSFECL